VGRWATDGHDAQGGSQVAEELSASHFEPLRAPNFTQVLPRGRPPLQHFHQGGEIPCAELTGEPKRNPVCRGGLALGLPFSDGLAMESEQLRCPAEQPTTPLDVLLRWQFAVALGPG
jgi:hypothetical protein